MPCSICTHTQIKLDLIQGVICITTIKLCKLYLNLHQNSLTAEEEFCFIRPVFQTIHTYHAFLSKNSGTIKKITAKMVVEYIIYDTA